MEPADARCTLKVLQRCHICNIKHMQETIFPTLSELWFICMSSFGSIHSVNGPLLNVIKQLTGL